MEVTHHRYCRPRRRGAIVVLAAILMVVLLAMVAFAIDLGYLAVVRTQAQNCADAAALAAAWEMADERRLECDMDEILAAARDTAIEYADLEYVNGTSAVLDRNDSNDPDGQIVFGRLEDPADRSESLSFSDFDRYNTALVRVECTPERGTAVPLFFARALGITEARVTAEAAAIFEDRNTVGFRVPDDGVRCSLMPFLVKIDDWQELLEHGGQDQWAYDPDARTVSRGSDGKPEMKMYPEKERQNSGQNQGTGITPGNFGKVDIGAHDNNRQDLFRQIREGPSAEDLAYYGGELRLDPVSGTLLLNGDMGMTASMQHPLADVLGQPRTIMLYDEVTGVGHHTWFTIVGFVGVRVVDFRMTGEDKYILIQPGIVIDRTVIPGDADYSYFVAQPVRLVR